MPDVLPFLDEATFNILFTLQTVKNLSQTVQFVQVTWQQMKPCVHTVIKALLSVQITGVVMVCQICKCQG